MTRTLPSAPRSDWWVPWPCPYFCMHVKRGPWQQTLKEGYRHWRWDVSANFLVSRTEITQPMRQWKPELETPSGHMKTSWLQWKDTNWSGMGMSHDRLDWPRLSCREQFKEEDKEADRGKDGKTTSNSGLALNGIYYYGKLRTARSRGSWS